MDWWIEYEHDRESRGYQILQNILTEVSIWIEQKFSLVTHLLPYHLEKGGIFYKDAGVLANFGCIGKNNLLVNQNTVPGFVYLRCYLMTSCLLPGRLYTILVTDVTNHVARLVPRMRFA